MIGNIRCKSNLSDPLFFYFCLEIEKGLLLAGIGRENFWNLPSTLFYNYKIKEKTLMLSLIYLQTWLATLEL